MCCQVSVLAASRSNKKVMRIVCEEKEKIQSATFKFFVPLIFYVILVNSLRILFNSRPFFITHTLASQLTAFFALHLFFIAFGIPLMFLPIGCGSTAHLCKCLISFLFPCNNHLFIKQFNSLSSCKSNKTQNDWFLLAFIIILSLLVTSSA